MPEYSSASISVGSVPMDSTNHRSKPRMKNMYWYFPCHYSLGNIVQSCLYYMHMVSYYKACGSTAQVTCIQSPFYVRQKLWKSTDMAITREFETFFPWVSRNDCAISQLWKRNRGKNWKAMLPNTHRWFEDTKTNMSSVSLFFSVVSHLSILNIC